MEALVKWNSKLSFTGFVRGHETPLDTTFANGSLNRGPSPKEMLLNSISACAGMDIASILEKNKGNLVNLEILANAEMTKTTPSYFANIHLVFKIFGTVTSEQAIKSCELSMTKYCGVSFMLAKVCPITYEVFLNNETVYKGISKFD